MGEFIGRNPEEPFELDKCLIVIAGPNLSGKTTLANVLAASLNVDILDIDEGWRAKWGTLENRPPMPEVYVHNHERAKPYLEEGKPVILVATYSQPIYSESLKEFMKATNSPLRVFQLSGVLGEELERRMNIRISDPNDQSDVRDMDRALAIRAKYIGIPLDDPDIRVMTIDSTEDPNKNVEMILASLVDLRKK